MLFRSFLNFCFLLLPLYFLYLFSLYSRKLLLNYTRIGSPYLHIYYHCTQCKYSLQVNNRNKSFVVPALMPSEHASCSWKMRILVLQVRRSELQQCWQIESRDAFDNLMHVTPRLTGKSHLTLNQTKI